MKQRLLLTFVSLLLATMFPVITWAKTGDMFQAELPEGVTAWFIVLDEDNKFCQFGLNANSYYYKTPTTIPEGTTGKITIPSEVNGYTVKALGYSALEDFTGITEVVIPNTVTRLKPLALSRTGITSITVPNSVTQIESSVFYGCTALTSINIPETVESIDKYAFSGCTSLTSVSLPSSVESIGKEAFSNCTSLTEVHLNKVKTMGDFAFSGCSALATADLGTALTAVSEYAFNNCPIVSLDIPATVESIGNYAFCTTNVPSLTSVTFHEGLKSIGEYAFAGSSSSKAIPATTLQLPNSVVSIGNGAFRYWTAIKELTLPASLETIGSSAFQYCTALETVTFGKKVKSINDHAFYGCTNISKVDIGDLTNWCSIDFDPNNEAASYSNGATALCTNPLIFAHKIFLNGTELDELTIPNGVTKIGLLAFAGCHRFDKLTIPASVKEIGDYAFYDCTGMDNIVFKGTSTLETIGTAAFRGCTGLTSVTLPASVTTFGNAVFRGCTNLESVNIPDGIIDIPSYTFYQCSKLGSITIPDGVKYLGSWSFYECTGLTRIDIPANVEIIGTEAFCNCSNLTGVYIKDLAKWCAVKFGNYQYQGSNFAPTDKISNPLYYANKLYVNGELVTNLVIPDGVESIEQFTFEGGASITSLIVPSSVKTIGKSAFSYCPNLRSITLPSTITDMQKRAFAYMNGRFNNEPQNKSNIKIYIDDLATWINNNYGLGFDFLTNWWGDNKIKLELYVDGERVSDIVIPESITSIGEEAFYAVSMNSVVLHKNVETVHLYAFSGSTLKTIYSQARFAPDIYNGTNFNLTYFSNEALKAIYVPSGKATAYKNKWTSHADIIKEADTDVKGEQSVESIVEAKEAVRMVYGKEADYIDLTGATLDGSVTAETLKAGDTSSNVLYYLPTGSTIKGDNIIVDGVAASVSLSDGAPVNVPVEFTATTLKNNRSFPQSSENAYTLCLPYDYTLPDGLKAYTLKEADAGSLVFTEVESIKANEPYLVMATETIDNLDATNVTMQVTPDEMEDKGTTGYEFRGTLQKIGNADAASMGAYILQANKKWHPVSTEKPSAYIQAGRAYLVPSLPGAARMFQSIFIDDSPTSIRMVSKDGTEQYFDLQGRKLEKPVKGINIVNGKKVIIK